MHYDPSISVGGGAVQDGPGLLVTRALGDTTTIGESE